MGSFRSMITFRRVRHVQVDNSDPKRPPKFVADLDSDSQDIVPGKDIHAAGRSYSVGRTGELRRTDSRVPRVKVLTPAQARADGALTGRLEAQLAAQDRRRLKRRAVQQAALKAATERQETEAAARLKLREMFDAKIDQAKEANP